MTQAGRIVQISISNGGVPKRAVEHARVTTLGIEGDTHRDIEHHGGPERAVCLYSMEAVRGLTAEGRTVALGALGENVTMESLDSAGIAPGVRLLPGDRVLLQVTRYTTPCFNIKPAFRDGEFGGRG